MLVPRTRIYAYMYVHTYVVDDIYMVPGTRYIIFEYEGRRITRMPGILFAGFFFTSSPENIRL